jgi:hypothetical protein
MNDSKNRYPTESGGDGFTPPSEIIADLTEPIDEDKISKKSRLHDIPLPERIESDQNDVVIDASDKFGANNPTQEK